MKVWVSGRLTLSNGELPGIVHESAGTVLGSGQDVAFECSVIAGAAQIVFTDPPANVSKDDLLRIARHILDHAILTHVVLDGVGVNASIEWIVSESGGSERAMCDTAPSTAVPVDVGVLQPLIGANPLLRWAARDFNNGLLDRENCPLYFYRSLETLVQSVTNRTEINRAAWNEFHAALGTNRQEISLIETLADQHRHGKHVKFPESDHLEMMRVTASFIRRSALLLARRESPISSLEPNPRA